MCRAYPCGFRPFETGLVYVSRGIGGVELPFRTFAPPDVLLVELARAAA
jgi:predicted MPP superfamily phosphohydrolase